MSERTPSQRSLPDFVVIGRVKRAHGIKGKLSVEPITDDPQRFKLLKSVFLSKEDGQRISFAVEEAQVSGKGVLLSLAEMQSREKAEKWRGAYVEIPRAECLPLPEGDHYYFELVGLEVITTEGQKIGVLEDFILAPAGDVYVVKQKDREILIPAIAEVIERIDFERGVMVINPIDGLLD